MSSKWISKWMSCDPWYNKHLWFRICSISGRDESPQTILFYLSLKLFSTILDSIPFKSTVSCVSSVPSKPVEIWLMTSTSFLIDFTSTFLLISLCPLRLRFPASTPFVGLSVYPLRPWKYLVHVDFLSASPYSLFTTLISPCPSKVSSIYYDFIRLLRTFHFGSFTHLRPTRVNRGTMDRGS